MYFLKKWSLVEIDWLPFKSSIFIVTFHENRRHQKPQFSAPFFSKQNIKNCTCFKVFWNGNFGGFPLMFYLKDFFLCLPKSERENCVFKCLWFSLKVILIKNGLQMWSRYTADHLHQFYFRTLIIWIWFYITVFSNIRMFDCLKCLKYDNRAKDKCLPLGKKDDVKKEF